MNEEIYNMYFLEEERSLTESGRKNKKFGGWSWKEGWAETNAAPRKAGSTAGAQPAAWEGPISFG